MKTIKKEFKKLFPDGLEINKNSKIETCTLGKIKNQL